MHKVKILKIEPITHNVKSFKVEKPKNYKFKPGQATEVAIDKPKWRNEKRPFTFASLNSDLYLEFIIKGYPLEKHPNHSGMTEELHKAKEGDYLLIGNPWGAIEYKGTGVFIAGGAGITPFIAIFRMLEKQNKLSGNKLLFSNKKTKDVILKNDLKKWFSKMNLTLLFTDEKEGQKKRINKDLLKKHISDFSTNFYICGPRQMVKDLRLVLEKSGASLDSIVFER